LSIEYYLGPDTRITFPQLDESNLDVPVCSGGNLSPGFLLSAYEQGLFPWYNPEDPVLWWSPDPRFVLFPNKIHVGKRLKRYIKSLNVTITVNKDFDKVIRTCRDARFAHTWIHNEMISAYSELHHLGKAHSIEVWRDSEFIGGLYGILTRKVFSGESMVSLVPNASKIALIALSEIAMSTGIELIDCQMRTPYLESMGGEYIPRDIYLIKLAEPEDTLSSFPNGSWAINI